MLISTVWIRFIDVFVEKYYRTFWVEINTLSSVMKRFCKNREGSDQNALMHRNPYPATRTFFMSRLSEYCYRTDRARASENVSSRLRKMCGFKWSCACARSRSGRCSPLIQSIKSNYSCSGQRRPWSDCADAQADLGLRCLHLPEDVFSHGEAHLSSFQKDQCANRVGTDQTPQNATEIKWRHRLVYTSAQSGQWLSKELQSDCVDAHDDLNLRLARIYEDIYFLTLR